MPIPAGFAQANFIYTGTSVPTGAEWTLGLELGISITDPEAAADALDVAYGLSGLAANLGTGCNLTSILVKFGPDATGPSHTETVSQVGAGGLAGPPNAAFLVNKVTLAGGRAGRGRFFMPCVPEANVDNAGVLGAGVVTAFQDDLNLFYSGVVDRDLFPTLLHGVGSPIPSPTSIIGFQLQAKVATQRRRLRR